jgi:hypothetical protein
VALADELKSLQELHEKGKLTDQEFADAKAATLKKQEPTGARQARRPFLSGPVKALIVCFLLFLGMVWYSAGTRNTTQLIATAVHTPITLDDEVENVPASSWKAIALNLPYSGTVDVSLQVVQGNPMDVFLTTPDQLDAMKKEDWNSVKVYGDFGATKTKTYRRTGRLEQGGYYLVLRDTSLGILSFRASDISVKARLNP